MPWPKLWSSHATHENNELLRPKTELRTQESIEHVPVSPHHNPGSRSNPSSQPGPSFIAALTEPRNVLATVILTTTSLALARFYRGYLRRIPQATNIHESFFRTRSVFGKVTSVGDGDNFRIYHTPGGRLTGWGWLPGRSVPTGRKELKDNTIHIRIAGVDAPELAHFGRPAQPYSQEALEWLTSYLRGRRVRAYVYKLDQYSRVVATTYVRRGFFRRDVGLQMIKAGFATVYEAKTGAEFGDGLEKQYRDAEQRARAKRKGMWAGNMVDFESPRQYKARHTATGAADPKDQIGS